MRTIWGGVTGGLWIVSLALIAGEPSDNRPPTESEIAELAKSIAKVLRGRNADAVCLGAFTNERDPKVSHGPGICQHLGRELTRLGIKTDAQAQYRVEGDYNDNVDKKTRRVFIELKCRLFDRKAGAALANFGPRRGIFGEEALIDFLTPAAVILDPSATPLQREESFVAQNDSDKPTVYLQGSKIFASDKREYGVEILVKKGVGYAPRMPELKGALLYVPLAKDEPFAIRLINGSPLDAAASVHIDGLDVFSFSDLSRQGNAAPRWMIARKKETALVGWPIRSGLSHEFLVTEYAKSAVAELNAADANVGVITVAFSAAWPKGGTPPEDEKEGARSRNAVGKGASVDTPFQVVPMTFGVPRAVLNIRYQR